MEDSIGQQQQQQQQQDRITSSSSAVAGERPVGPDNLTGQVQQVSTKDERIVSANPSLDAASIIGLSRDVTDHPEFSDAGGDLGTVYSHNVYASHEQTMYYGGYDNSIGGYPQYVNVDGLQVVPPVIYNENSSLMYHTGYGYNPEMAYGQQYSPVATPLPSVVVDGQLYSPQQVPFSPSYYPQPVAPSVPHISSTVPFSQTELLTPQSGGHEGFNDNMLYSPGSGYFVPFGTFGGDLSGNSGFYNLQRDLALGKHLSNGLNSTDSDRLLSPLASPAAYPQPFGILGSYEHNVGQRPMHGFGLVSSSSAGRYPHGGSYQSPNFGNASVSRSGGTDRNRLNLDKGRRRERDRDSIFISNDSYDISNDRNRGPRASKPKGKSSAEDDPLSSMTKNGSSTSAVSLDIYNLADFVSDYESAKFFIIKSFSEDNVHKSIKYNVWASTPLGNRKLDASYHEAKEIKGNCPVFLLFSVNASAQFCGVAEMVGPVDFEKDAEYWQQDRWSGQFPVHWHIIKDVPNSRFRHILLENNENKPVTHSRDTQEVKLEQGVEMLRIFKNHEARTSILDDFDFYNERERSLQERKAKQKASSKTGTLVPLDNQSVSSTTDVSVSLANESPSTATNVPVSLDQHLNQVVENFAETLKLEESGKDVSALNRGGEQQT